MPRTAEKLPNEPILILKQDAEFNFSADGEQAMKEMVGMLNNLPEPTFLILDVSEMQMNLDDIIKVSNMATHQYPLFTHPKVREVIFIVHSRLIELSLKGLSSSTFGSINLKMFDSRSAALAYVRSQVAAHNG